MNLYFSRVQITVFVVGVLFAFIFLFSSAQAALEPAAFGVSSGSEQSCASLTDGTIRCWGGNWGGQIGNGNTSDQFAPAQVSGISDSTAVFAGMYHSCAIITGGAVKCWGANWSGQLGDGSSTDRSTPVSVNSLTGAIKIAGGSSHTCALLSSGSIKCWGGNSKGQLGNGSTNSSDTPVSVSGITNAIDLTAGEYHTCAVLSGGGVKCWGNNTKGQLGDGTTTRRKSPTAVTGVTNASKIDAGSYHTCAVLSGGGVKCWGDNTRGQLGNNSTTSSSSPVSVSGISSATAISTSFSYDVNTTHSCAIISGGAIKCWGDNSNGQLGNGNSSSTAQKIPVSVSGITGATHISAGNDFSCARLGDKTVKCWGDDYAGFLGDGSGDSSTDTPVLVVNLEAEGDTTPPECIESDWSYVLSPTQCPVSETQTKTWTLDNQSCQGGVTHPSSEQISCVYNAPACTESDWSSTIDPTVCPVTEVQTKTWTLDNQDCSSGVSHPDTEQISCTYTDPGGGSTGGFWSQIGTALNYLTGYVGIGTSTPQEALDVVGNIQLTGNILSNGDICIGTCQ